MVSVKKFIIVRLSVVKYYNIMVEQLEFDHKDWEAIVKGDQTKEEVDRIVKKIFEALDKDNSGSIGMDEMRASLEKADAEWIHDKMEDHRFVT
jgi:hypothetical protein